MSLNQEHQQDGASHPLQEPGAALGAGEPEPGLQLPGMCVGACE